MSDEMSKKEVVAWQRYLYLEQPYTDNHVDETFLMGLRRNENVRHRTVKEVMLLSLPISQQFSSLFIIFHIFVSLYEGVIDAPPLFLTNAVLTLLGLFIWLYYRTKMGKFNAEAFLISLIILALSPMLGSLTVLVSSETIITVVTPFLMLTNIVFHDYSSTSESTYRYPDSFSINVGISAAALLASRLKSNFQIVTLVYTAISLLVLFPLLRRLLRKVYPKKSDVIITLALIVTFVAIFARNYPTIAMWHTLSIFLISVIAPLIFQYAKKYKREYSGPWDEAKVPSL